MDEYLVSISYDLEVMYLCSSRLVLSKFKFANTIIFIDLSLVSVYSISHNLTNRTVILEVLSFGFRVFHNATNVDLSSEGGSSPLRELRILMPPNIVEPSSISPTPTIGVTIEMSSMTSALAHGCVNRCHPPIPTLSFEVEPIIVQRLRSYQHRKWLYCGFSLTTIISLFFLKKKKTKIRTT